MFLNIYYALQNFRQCNAMDGIQDIDLELNKY